VANTAGMELMEKRHQPFLNGFDVLQGAGIFTVPTFTPKKRTVCVGK
jgi:hypothetical protein